MTRIHHLIDTRTSAVEIGKGQMGTVPGSRVELVNEHVAESPTTMRPTDCLRPSGLLRCSIEERQGPAFVGGC
jgi:hypothetical protein